MQNNFFIEANKKYVQTVLRLQKNVPEIFIKNKRSNFVERLIGNYGRKKTKLIDFNKDYLAFNKAFFLKNLYKCFITAEFLKSKINFNQYHFIDVGCGAGTFTLAIQETFEKNDVSFSLIDSCKKQLMLAEKIIRPNNYVTYHGTFPQTFNEIEGVRLASYWLCEQQDDIFTSGEDFIKTNIVNQGAIFIDYQETINKLLMNVSPDYEYIKWSLKFLIPKPTKEFVNEHKIKVHGVAIFKK